MRAPQSLTRAGQRLTGALLTLCGEGAACLAARERPWASATFTGQQHFLTLRLTGAEAEARARILAARLPEVELDLPRLLLADMVVDAIRAGAEHCDLDIAALTLDDC